MPTAELRLTAAVAELRNRPIAPTEKGFGALPPGPAPVTTTSLAGRRLPLLGANFTLPILTLRETALRQNTSAMADWCAAAGVELAPHGKTTMAPQLFARQLAAGAWGITAATIGQARACREFGIGRIMIANEVTDPAGIRWLAAELAADPSFDCYAFVDSVAGVAVLDAGLDAGLDADGATRPLKVLVELGFPGQRTGCRGRGSALEVAAAVASARHLRLAGAAGYEGGFGPGTSQDTLDDIAGYCRYLRILARELAMTFPRPGNGDGGPGQWIVSAGGSAYFDVVARELAAAPGPGDPPLTVVLRGGCYLTHDHGTYARTSPGPGPGRGGPELTGALELWAPVLSRPEPGLALALAGRRDVSFDQGFPVPLRIRAATGDPGTERPADGIAVTRLDDQHAYLSLPDELRLDPGDLICLGVSHPCTTFDKWRVIPVTDDDYRVTDVVHTFF